MNLLVLSALTIISGAGLLAIVILLGPLGVPGYFTYRLCSVNPFNGGSCIYDYTLEVFGGSAGAGLIAAGVIVLVRSCRKRD